MVKRATIPKKRSSNLTAKIIIVVIILLGLFITASAIAGIITFSGGDFIDPNADTIIIPIEGVITSTPIDAGRYGMETVSADDIKDLIDKAVKRQKTKAIVFEINSPGGSAVASDEIGQYIKDIPKSIATVAWIREIGASGGYWIASSTDYIIANRMSITGSIGVTASYIEFAGLLNRYNMTYRQLIAGNKKDLGTPLRKLKDDEKSFLEDKLEKIHWFFINQVAENRNMTFDEVKKLATGEFFLGYEAKDNGLVDEIGGEKEMLAYVKKRGAEPITTVFEKKQSFLEKLARAMHQDTAFNTLEKQRIGIET